MLNILKKAKTIKEKHVDSTEICEIDESIWNNIKKVGHVILKEDGFGSDIVEYFNLGVALGGYFDQRVTIPIDYTDGRIVSMSGRLPDKYVDNKNPKYKILNDSIKSKTSP